MKVQGYEVPEGILATIEAWMKDCGRSFTAGDLQAVAKEATVVGGVDLDAGVAMRLADRLIQKHSKAGSIEKRSQQGARVRWGWKT
jgi:hypothetical protein